LVAQKWANVTGDSWKEPLTGIWRADLKLVTGMGIWSGSLLLVTKKVIYLAEWSWATGTVIALVDLRQETE